MLRIDGRRPLTAEAITAVTAVCDRTEDGGGRYPVIVQVSGTPKAP